MESYAEAQPEGTDEVPKSQEGRMGLGLRVSGAIYLSIYHSIYREYIVCGCVYIYVYIVQYLGICGFRVEGLSSPQTNVELLARIPLRTHAPVKIAYMGSLLGGWMQASGLKHLTRKSPKCSNLSGSMIRPALPPEA